MATQRRKRRMTQEQYAQYEQLARQIMPFLK